MAKEQGKFNNVGQFVVTHADLPLSCPMKDEPLWDAHPRVYLPIEEAGRVTCPYCSAQYILEGFLEDSDFDIDSGSESIEQIE